MTESIEDILREVAAGRVAPFDAARSMASMLKAPELDWRNLARALGQITKSHLSDMVTGESRQNSLQNAALLAMELASRALQGEATKARTATTALELRRACAADRAPTDMLRRVAKILQDVIPCEITTYAEYQITSKGETLVRGWFATDGEEEFEWPSRWMHIGPGLVEWLKGDRLWFESMDDFRHSSADAAKALTDPVSKLYLERGVRSFLIVPLKEGDRVVATVTLARKAANLEKFLPFSEQDQDFAQQLGLSGVVALIFAARRAERRALRDRIMGLFTADADPQSVAKHAVDYLATGYGWEYAAIFRLSRVRRRYEVVSEYDPSGRFAVRADFVQELDAGMLGTTRRAGEPLIAYDLRESPPEHGYVRKSEAPVSAMCFPIRLRKDIEWLLHCESSQPHTFQEPDKLAVERMLQHFETTLALWFESRLNTALLEIVSQGVVITDEANKIERVNGAALQLLGVPKADATRRKLDTFGADDGSRSLLSWKNAPSTPAHVRLSTEGGPERGAMIVARDSSDTFGRRIWLLNNLDELKWVEEWPRLRATVHGVAAQTRGPLLLAASLIRKAMAASARDTPSSEARSLLDRALRSLAKADITYERLAISADVLEHPLRQSRMAPLGLAGALREMHSELTGEDRDALKLNFPSGLPLVWADAGRLLFAVRSIISYLLAVRLPGRSVVVAAEPCDPGLRLCATLTGTRANPADAPQDDDRVQQIEREALDMTAIATEAAAAVIKAHGGSLRSEQDADEVRFTILLPDAAAQYAAERTM